MKKFVKIAGYIAGVLVLVVIAGLIYFNSRYPDVDNPQVVKVEITPERLKRGEYLANHVTGCMDCHGKRDWTKFTGPIVPGYGAKGGGKFGKEMGFPGNIYAKNITPAGIGDWTDGEVIRAITQGVTRDDQALFPLMPYMGFNHLTKEDLYSIVAYIRSLEPMENKVPDTDLDFPLNFIVKTMPIKSYTPAQETDRKDHAAYGKYLVTIASCTDCHTQAKEGKPLPGMFLAGGMSFNLPMGTVRSANITPDKETGIGNWTKEEFVARFKSFDSDSAKNIPVGPHDYNTVMPWTFFSGMTEEDLGDIFEYLKTIEPVNNSVIRFTPAANK